MNADFHLMERIQQTPIETALIHLTRALSNSWIGTELSKKGPIVQKGRSEVYMTALK